MKKAIKCPNCNTYFEIEWYGGLVTTYLECENCKFPLRIKTIDTINRKIEIISLLSDKCYFNEVKHYFWGYSEYTNKPPLNLNLNF